MHNQPKRRRSKVEGIDRSYNCGCGKTYLSYSALYTHVKFKHNGEQPHGTNQHTISNIRGRGRPRKNPSTLELLNQQTGQIDQVYLKDRMVYGGPIDALLPLSQSDEQNSTQFLQEKIYEQLTKTEEDKEVVSECSVEEILAIYFIHISKFINEDYYLRFIECMTQFYDYVFKNDENQQHKIALSSIDDFISQRESFLAHLEVQGSFPRNEADAILTHFCRWTFSHSYSDIGLDGIAV